MKKGRKNKPLSRRTARRKSSVKNKAKGKSYRTLAVRAWWTLRGVLVGLLLAALVYGGWLGTKAVISHPNLSVRNVVVRVSGELGEEDIRELSGVRIGQPLLGLDLEEIRNRILRHPGVKNAVVVRQLPDTLQIEVEDRRPAAMVVGSRFFLVDMEGVVLASGVEHSGDYPLITGIVRGGKPGEVMVEAVPALRVLAGLSTFGLVGLDQVSEIRLTKRGKALVSLVDSGIVLVMKAGGSPDQLARLARLMDSSNYDKRAAGYDLRFDGRVIKLPERTIIRKSEAAPGGGSEDGQG
jgi:cell division protein FtsQ